MSDILWIQNGRVIDPANKRDAVGNIYAVDGILCTELSKAQKEMLVSSAKSRRAGLVDIHDMKFPARHTKKISAVVQKLPLRVAIHP